MEAPALDFLQRLLEAPSPSGFEEPAQKVVREFAAPHAEKLTTDVHGNVVACLNPGASPRVMLAGHCDQIGMLVTHFDDNGFVYAQTIGGWDPQQLIGQRMVIWSADGPVPAVISRKPIHLLTPEEQKQVVKLEDMWLDIGATTKTEAENMVRIGDPVTLKLGMQTLRGSLATAPGMDDSVGVWVVFEALRRAAEKNIQCGLYSVSTVQEEIGLRGARTSAFSVDPHVGIAVDVTHATDCPTIDKRQQGDIRLGRGPVIYRGPNMNPVVVARLIEAAKRSDIPFQLAASGRAAANDSNSIQVSRAGVASAVVAIPNRYMHSAVEVVSLDDLDHAANLLAEFVASVQPGDEFIP